MKEELISFETAKLAKEKGFNELIQGAYRLSSKPSYEDGYGWNKNSDNIVLSAPTQALLQKWLRENHKIFLWVFSEEYGKTFGWEIEEIFQDKSLPVDGIYEDIDIIGYNFKTFEQALEKGLQTALKLIKL